MSYVLDALRKSEQERQQAAGPAASVLFPVMVEQQAARRRWPLVAVAVAALAGAIAWWLLGSGVPVRPQQPPAAEAAAVVSAPVSIMASVPSAPSVPAALPESVEAPTFRVEPPPPPPRSVEAKARPVEARAAPRRLPAPAAARPAGENVPETAVVRPVAPPAAPEKLADAPERLPAALLKELPPLSIAGYINDPQGGKLVMINDKLLREGDEVVPGVRLEQILGDGAVFSYKGFRFRR